MVQDLGAKYDILSKTVAEKQGGKEPLANIFQNDDSMFTMKWLIQLFPRNLRF
jgi:hypothetical protein